MKTVYTLLVSFLLMSFIISPIVETDPIYSEELEKSYALHSTKSFDLPNNVSVHLATIRVRNSEEQFIIPYVVGADKKVRKLSRIVGQKNEKIITHHSNGNVFSFVRHQSKERKVFLTDIDIKTGKSTLSESVSISEVTYKTSRDTESVVLFHSEEIPELHTLIFKNSSNVIKKVYKIPESDREIFSIFLKLKADEIINDEFSEYASLNRNKFYNRKDDILFVLEGDENAIHTFNITMDESEEFTFNTFALTDEFKDINSFYKDGQIYVIGVTKEFLRFIVFDTNTGEELLKIDGASSFRNAFIDEKSLLKLQRKAAGRVFRPSIAVNEVTTGDLLVTLSYKNPIEYNYHYDFWWHQQQFMQMQQFHNNAINASIPRFQPSGSWYDEHYDIAGISEVQEEFEFILTAKMEIKTPEEGLETVLKKIEKTDIYDKYDAGKRKTSEASGAFHKEEAIFIYFDKKEKSLNIDAVPFS